MSRLQTSFRFAATTTLAVAVALGAISHLRGGLVGWVFPRHTCYVRSEYGKLAVHAHMTDWCQPRGPMASTWPHAELALSPGIGGWWRYGGFNYARGGTGAAITVHQLAIPYWSIALGALVVRLLCPGAGRTPRWFSSRQHPAASTSAPRRA